MSHAEQRARSLIDPLLNQLRSYRYPDSVRRDVVQLVSMLPSLTPVIGTINFDMSRTTSAICLQGTVPMYYKGNRYNIPVNIWVMEDYPYRPPMPYVTPTENMSIKQNHKHVDTTGRCHVPYLTQWNPQACNLYELINHLSAVFGADPPVFQKPVAATQPPPPAAAAVSASPHPQHYQPPPQSLQPRPAYSQPPPPSQHQQQPPPQHSPFYQPQPFAQQPQYRQQGYPVHNNGNGVSRGSVMPPPPPSIESRKKELNAKVQSKMTSFVQEFVQKMEQEMDSQSKLNARSKILEDQEKKLLEDQENFKKDIETETQKIEKLEEWIEEHKDKEIDVDKLITPSGIHSKQILECIAEDNAIDDMIYILDRSLQNETISLDTYLKYVRRYARLQFEKRALIKKITAQQQGVKP